MRRGGSNYSRRIRTEGHEVPSTDQQMDLDESFDLPAPSLSSIPTRSSSWDTNSFSDGDDNTRRLRRERQKFDTTTPTLIDEDDATDVEEQEIVSLETEGLGRGMAMKSELSLRRTPGASMYSSAVEHRTAALRRTPGANAMYQSSRAHQTSSSGEDDAAILKFGLNLATPDANDLRMVDKDSQLAPVKSMESYSSSESSESPSKIIHEGHRPPRAPSSTTRLQEQRDSAAYTPAGWTLSKNPHLEVSHGSFSPYTLRLTEDIDNLLLEEDDKKGQALLARQQVFRSQLKSILSAQSPVHGTDNAKDEAAGSWMKSYIFDRDGGSATSTTGPRAAAGRGRRGSGRRSRAGETTKEAEFHAPMPQQKPTPVRHTSAVKSQFSVGNFSPNVPTPKPHTAEMLDITRSGPLPLNFGGAFVPPSKGSVGSFRRVVPHSGSVAGRKSAFQAGTSVLPDSREGKEEDAHEKAYPSIGSQGRAYANSYQYDFQAPHPMQVMNPSPLVGPPRSSQVSLHGPPGEMGFQGDLHPTNYGSAPLTGSFARNSEMTPGPGFHPVSPYPVDQAHLSGRPYTLMQSHQNPQQSFVQPGWSPMMQYPAAPNTGTAGWQPQGINESWGPINESSYGFVDPRTHLTPSPQFNAWPDGEFRGVEPKHQSHLKENISRTSFAVAPASPLPSNFAGPHLGEGPGFRFESQNTTQSKEDEKTLQQGRSGRKKTSSEKTAETPGGQIKKTGQASQKKKKQPGEATPSRGKGIGVAEGEGIKMTPGTSSRPEDPADVKRAELVESPTTRAAFKDFYREFRARERSSFKEAEEFALETMNGNTIPEKMHWRLYLELADLAKRANRFNDARQLYRKVCQLQPYASQGWLEYSKLEEECGHLSRCSKILHAGLAYCEFSENLLTRAIKHEEKLGNIDLARQLLARLKHAGIEKVWRTVLEGALMEARVGNAMMARKVLKVLMRQVPWYGPLYLEAYRLEKDLGKNVEALAIVERGLASIPRYGPLWFGAFRLCELLDIAEGAADLPRTTAMFERATINISRELIWKVHLEAAQIYGRNAFESSVKDDAIFSEKSLELCRLRFAMTVACCPINLSWKVWLASGRMELSTGNAAKARKLLLRAKQVVPEKGRVTVLLECARLEEFVGNSDLARALLCKGRLQNPSDWKTWLESVLLEVRSGNHQRAIDFAKHALETHNGTGRLWAALIQLRYYDGGEDAQYAVLRRALWAVPKSGEVWCEGGRIHMNPFSKTFDLAVARRHLFFATRFTPQYGDSFLEALKLEILEQWVAPVAFSLWKTMEWSFTEKLIESRANGGGSDEIVRNVVRRTVQLVRQSLHEKDGKEQPEKTGSAGEEVFSSLREGLDRKFFDKIVDNSDLELRCANADPNYGLLWFHCRQGPIDGARTVIASARELFANELVSHADIYVAAVVRRFAIIVALKHDGQNLSSGSDPTSQSSEPASPDLEALEGWEALLEARLRSAPSLDSILNDEEKNEKSGMALLEGSMSGLEGSMSGSDFLTGLVELNKFRPLQDMSLIQRRKAIFGSDALFS